MMVMVMQLKMLEDWTFEDHEYLALVLNVFTLQAYDLVIYVRITLALSPFVVVVCFIMKLNCWIIIMLMVLY